MGMKKNNINIILSMLSEKKQITLNEIEDVLNIKERNARSYIKYLKEIGIDIKVKNGVYYINDKLEINGGIISNSDIRKLQILTTVKTYNNKLTRKELKNKIKNDLYDYDLISEKTIERAIDDCLKEGYIEVNKNLYSIGILTPALYKVPYDDIEKFIDKSNSFNYTIPFYVEAEKLHNKIIEECGYCGWDYNIFSLGRKYNNNNFEQFFIKINKFNYKKFKLTIKYKTKTSTLTKTVGIVTFLYSKDKDRLYIISKHQNNIIFIKSNSIIECVQTDEINNSFGDKNIIKEIDYMFEASLGNIYNVCVEFDNVFNIKRKLTRLANSRKYANIYENGHKIIYKDKISGLYDFARFLRRFGASCKVIEPIELKNIMIKTYQLIIESYSKES